MNLYELPRKYSEFLGNPIATHFIKTWLTEKIDTFLSTGFAGGIPDISGYNVIFLKPPILSGLLWNPLKTVKYFYNCLDTVFLAQDYNPPEIQILNNEIASTMNLRVPYGVGRSSGGNFTISYLENATLDVYEMHHSWFHYIEQVILGEVQPTELYYSDKTLDYATCAYVIKYKPDLRSITYIGKAIGLFPVSIPTKEVVGTRNNYQTTVYTVPYICTDYQDVILKGTGSILPVSNFTGVNDWLIIDFMIDVYAMFAVSKSLSSSVTATAAGLQVNSNIEFVDNSTPLSDPVQKSSAMSDAPKTESNNASLVQDLNQLNTVSANVKQNVSNTADQLVANNTIDSTLSASQSQINNINNTLMSAVDNTTNTAVTNIESQL
jgi:hypothetical protein